MSDSKKFTNPINPFDPVGKFAFSNGHDSFNTYPGINGIPHRAQVARPLKNNDPEHLQPKPGGQIRCQTFDLSNADELLAYTQTMSTVYTMASNNKAVISYLDRRFVDDPTNPHWVACVEWIEFFTFDAVNPREIGEDRLRRG